MKAPFLYSTLIYLLLGGCYEIASSPVSSEVNIEVSQGNPQNPLYQHFSAQFSPDTPSNTRWDFGDGYSTKESNTDHQYNSPGEYQATLTYTLNGEPLKATVAVLLEGVRTDLNIEATHALALDSDNNDPNQSLTSNNQIPQLLSPPISVSGILLQAGACQAGNLCQQGDLKDRYSFPLEYGDKITIEILKGSVDLALTSKLKGNILKSESQHFTVVISAEKLGQDHYTLDITLPASEPRAQYLINIEHQIDEKPSDYQPGKLIVLWKGKRQPELIDISDPRLSAIKHADFGIFKQRLSNQAEVSSVSLNYIRRPLASENLQQWPLNFQDIQSLWRPLLLRGQTPGQNTTVAVIDTGIYSNHPNLKNLSQHSGYDFISDPINAADGDSWDSNPEDPGDSQQSYHGTHVTGIIAAQPSTNEQDPNSITGIAWGTQIMPLRVLGTDGGTSYDLIQALRYAAGLKNDTGRLPIKAADIINLSLGGSQFSAAEQATLDEIINSGAIVVAASGNQESSQVNYPAAYRNVIAVGAINKDSSRSPYSNFGPYIDLVAPGGECLNTLCLDGILSLGATGALRNHQDQRAPTHYNLAGTSMAAAHISGMLSIVRSYLPSLDAPAFMQLLSKGLMTQSILPMNSPLEFNEQVGWGTLDSNKLMTLMDSSPLDRQRLWSTQMSVQLEAKQSVSLPIISRGTQAITSLEASADSSQLQTSIKGNLLHITAKTLFNHPAEVIITSQNTPPLTIYVTPAATDNTKQYIEHLYLQSFNEAGRQKIGRAIIQENGWHGFIAGFESNKEIQASTDLDYDGVYCEPGEFCAYTNGSAGAAKNITIKGRFLHH